MPLFYHRYIASSKLTCYLLDIGASRDGNPQQLDMEVGLRNFCYNGYSPFPTIALFYADNDFSVPYRLDTASWFFMVESTKSKETTQN